METKFDNTTEPQHDAKLPVSSRSIEDIKRICKWYVEWTNNRESNGVELFGLDYELKNVAERVLSELNGC